MSAARLLVCCWLGLAALSVLSVKLGAGTGSLLLVGGVLLAALAKAWLIADGFMELRHAPRLWRALLLAWPLCMAAGILLTLSF